MNDLDELRRAPRWLDAACARRNMGGRGGRRGGGGGRRAFDPRQVSRALLWWDPTVVTTVSGGASSWTDRIAGVSFTQSTASLRPAVSAQAIGGAYPGVTGDGGDQLVAAGAGAVLSGKSQITMVAVMVDSEAGLTAKVCAELTANATTNNGGFFLAVNDNVSGRIYPGIRGTTGFTEVSAAETLSSVKVVSIGYDFSTAGAGAIAFVRVNGVAQSLTSVLTASAAGVAANASLFLFSRSGPTLGWAGSYGHLVFLNGIGQDADLSRIEKFGGSRAGLSL